jgi:hypothetical protein
MCNIREARVFGHEMPQHWPKDRFAYVFFFFFLWNPASSLSFVLFSKGLMLAGFPKERKRKLHLPHILALIRRTDL